MRTDIYDHFTIQSLSGEALSLEEGLQVLTDPKLDLFFLLNAAYRVRKHHWGREVQIHILNNAQNGRCPEDCAYCTQARTSEESIEEYPLKPDHEILEEARLAYEGGAHRYCMVFAGRGPSESRVRHLADLIRKIKQQFPLEVCVSPGLLDEAKAKVLAEAGLDRLNHNLNTSERNYPNICTTHTYADRVRTLRAAREAGLQVCSGLIAGMGESPEELVKLAATLRELKAESIPVNFLIPFPGNALNEARELTPEYCLRVLCLFRFMNPAAEVRCAAGREYHLRGLQVFCLYPANSIFLQGYLNARGSERKETLRMIRDAGFTITSEAPLEELIEEEKQEQQASASLNILKTHNELRPAMDKTSNLELQTSAAGKPRI